MLRNINGYVLGASMKSEEVGISHSMIVLAVRKERRKAMTDKEIIKALECCHKGCAECRECPLRYTSGANADCIDRLTGSALNLINRQKAEIKRYKGVI